MIGDFEPEFTLPSTAGTDVSLASFRGGQNVFFTQRAYFLIDRAGKLRWQHTEAELGHRREDAELLRRIAAL